MKSCGDCNLCCKVVAVESIEKAAGKWCEHARPGAGCGIYGSHPEQCRGFICLWLEDPSMPDAWKPNKSKLVIRADGSEMAVAVDVDSAYPNAWRKEPFYSEIKQWSRIAWGGKGRVVVYVGDRAWVIFPEEDLSVGKVQPGDYLYCGYRRGGGWMAPFASVRHASGGQSEFLGKALPS